MADEDSLHYELSGPAEAPWLVLSPSLGTDLGIWRPAADGLSDRFRILRYDLRGHGQSSAPPGPYSIADLGLDLLGLLDRLEIAQAALCGVSIGAMASLWLTAHRPDRVARVIACCTAARFGDQVRADYRERAGRVREQGLEPIADQVLARWFTSAFQRENPEAIARVRASLLATTSHGYAGCCEALAEMDLLPELGQITAPSLVIVGRHDKATPPEKGRLISERIGDSRLVEVQGAHLAVLESAGAVSEAISEFLDEREEADV